MKPTAKQRDVLTSLADSPAFMKPGLRYRLRHGSGDSVTPSTAASLIRHGWAKHLLAEDGHELHITSKGLAAVQKYL